MLVWDFQEYGNLRYLSNILSLFSLHVRCIVRICRHFSRWFWLSQYYHRCIRASLGRVRVSELLGVPIGASLLHVISSVHLGEFHSRYVTQSLGDLDDLSSDESGCLREFSLHPWGKRELQELIDSARQWGRLLLSGGTLRKYLRERVLTVKRVIAQIPRFTSTPRAFRCRLLCGRCWEIRDEA